MSPALNTRRPSSARLLTFLCVFFVMVSAYPVSAGDMPEHVQQYRYALGLIRRQLYEEADRVLQRLHSDPAPFSNRDGVLFWLAECRSRQRKDLEAAGLYSQLLKDFPTSTFRDRAAYGLGWSHVRDNNPKSGVEAFAQVSKSDIDLWIDARLKMGHLLVTCGFSPDQVLSHYEDLLKEPKLKPEQRFEAHLQTGIGRFQGGIYLLALEQFQLALPLAPPARKAAIVFYIAECLFRSDRFPEAIKQYDEVISLSPGSDLARKARYSTAWCHIKTGNAKAARPLFEIEARDPASPVRKEAAKNLVDLLFNLHKYEEAVEWLTRASHILDGDDAVDMRYLRGLALSRLGEYDKSLAAFTEFLQQHPKHSRAEEARYQAGLVLISLSRFRDALDMFKPLLEGSTSPQIREKAMYRMGECHFNLGSISAASETFQRLLKEYPRGVSQPDALYQLGEIAYQSGDHADALRAFEAVAERGIELSALAAFRMGEVLMKAARYGDAAKTFEDYLAAYPKGTLREDALFKIGLCQLELKDQGKALAAFSQLRDSTGYFRQEARFQIGEIARSLQNHALAIQQYKAILTEDPEHPLGDRARLGVSECLFHLKEYPAAVTNLQELLKKLPLNSPLLPEVLLWLGRAHIAAGRADDGILEILRIPLQHGKSPLVAEAYAEAARAYAATNREAKARQMWQELVEAAPNHPLAQEARKNLN